MINGRLHAGFVLVVVIALACAFFTGGAEAGSAGYTVQPGASAGICTPFCGIALAEGTFIVAMTASDIGVGERKHFVKNVNSDITTLNLDLKWQNTAVGLKLLAYSPAGVQFGPWDDGADGRLDHEINMDIDNPGGIEKGQWHYYVIYDKGAERTAFSI